MSAEKQTRVKSDLPQGDWLVAMRLVGFGDITFNDFEGDALKALMPEKFGSSAVRKVTQAEGRLYVEFEAKGIDGDKAVHDSTALIWAGLGRTALPADVEAMCDSSDQINPERPIQDSFTYMKTDATHEVRDTMADFDIEPPEVGESSMDFVADLEHSISQ
jgi:hypothetical protein